MWGQLGSYMSLMFPAVRAVCVLVQNPDPES